MYRIKNWDKFQHFKDRRPPWIKLYRDILDDLDWHELDGNSAKILVSLWLIASEDFNGVLPDIKRLAFRLRIKESQVKQELSKLSHWLERCDISVISGQYQDDRPETETEKEKEKEKEKETDSRQAATVSQFDFLSALLAEGVSEQTARDYLAVRKSKKGVNTETAFNGLRAEVIKSGYSMENALAICCRQNWLGFNSEWVSKSKPMTQHQLNQAATARALFGNSQPLKTIDMETNNESVIASRLGR